MRILINQSTRMGDVVQTGPLVRMLRAKHPDAHIAIMVRRMGKIVAERHPDIDEIILYDEDAFFVDLRARDSDRFLRAYEMTDKSIKELRAGRFDIAYNVTHSLASAMMMALGGIPECVGASLNEDGQYVLRGAWVRHFFTSVFSRDYNDLNICDLIRNFAPDAPSDRRLAFDVRDEDRRAARAVLAANNIGDGDFLVAMQLGASELNKRWAEHRFAELARLLRERHAARIVLVGVKEEAPLGERFAQVAPGLAVPLYGKTSVPELAALLEQARVLVTNDTGTMHIAAAVNCPVALVSVGNVHYRETGPYGEGHCAIEAHRHTLGQTGLLLDPEAEKDKITAEQAYQAVRIALDRRDGELAPPLEDSPSLLGAELFCTQFAPDGCLQFYPVVLRPMAERDFVRIAYRAMWLEHLSGKADAAIETQSIARMLARYLGHNEIPLAQWESDLGAMFGGLATLAERGIRRTEALLAALRDGGRIMVAKQLVAELMQLDDEMRVYSEVHPPCKPLIMAARFERDNLEGADPMRLAQTTLDIYKACAARARLMQAKLARIAALWREMPA